MSEKKLRCFFARRDGESNASILFLEAHLTLHPNATFLVSGKGSERFLEKLPEHLRTNVVLVPYPPQRELACHRCGVRSRMAIEFCEACGFNVYSDILGLEPGLKDKEI